MDPLTNFILSFLCTTVALVGVIWTGLQWRVTKRRKLHLSLVGLTVALLAVTIVMAVRLGDYYDLDSAGAIYPVHMFLAKLATFGLLAPVITGAITLRTGERHRYHRICAFTAFGLILLAATTGTWMILASTPL